MEHHPALIGFIGAIIGAIVGGGIAGFFSLWATRQLLTEERKKSKDERAERVNALLSALDSEIRNVWAHYMETTGKIIAALPDNQPFRFFVPIVADYFPVYHGNVNALGLITDDILRHKIISTYNVAKALVDTYRLNNQLFKERDAAADQVFYMNAPQTNQVLKLKEQNLAAYGPTVKDSHFRAKKEVEELLEMLDTVTIAEKTD